MCFLLVTNPEQLISHTGEQVTASGNLMCLCRGWGRGRLAVPAHSHLPQVFMGALDQPEEGTTDCRSRWRLLQVPLQHNDLPSHPSWFRFRSIPDSSLLQEPQEQMDLPEEGRLTV